MIQFLRSYLSFGKLIKLIADIPYKVYHIIMFLLISVCINCNYFSIHKLPMIGILVAGFVVIVYFDIYSIKQTYEFLNNIGTAMAGDNTLLLARTRLEKRMYSNLNWPFILIAPAFILPVVIYIIRRPLGLPIKIFAYTALYIIIALCLIGYMQYINLIRLAHDCSKDANQISIYDHTRPHKTEWIVKLASLTNKQSNLFFLVGSGFIALLYLITFTNYYAVHMDEILSKTGVFYLWAIVTLAIVIMFPVFSLCSYFCIKSLITKLVDKEIRECNTIQNMAAKSRKKQRHLELLQAMGQIKILMLEKAPEYPQKPFVAYAASYIIAAINFAATVQAAISLVEYIP
jgi:hypothetical protein